MFKIEKEYYINRDEKKKGLTRREVLKAGVLGALGLAGLMRLRHGLENKPAEEREGAIDSADTPESPTINLEIPQESAEEPLGESVENPEEGLPSSEEPVSEKDAVAYALKFDLSHDVKFSPKMCEATQRYWVRKYTEEPGYVESLDYAYTEMQPHMADMERAFNEINRGISDKNEKVPLKYIYLAIPESHWNWKDASGPFQIISKTAASYNLKYEDRSNPYKAAKACAGILRDNYRQTRSWDLALYGYNREYMWNYLKGVGTKNCSAEGFVSHMEASVNSLKMMLRKSEWPYEVRPGDTLSSICDFFEVNLNVLIQRNGIRKDSNGNPLINAGMILNVPITKMSVKKKIYDAVVPNYKHNLEYPERFKAIWQIISDKRFNELRLQRSEERKKKKLARRAES